MTDNPMKLDDRDLAAVSRLDEDYSLSADGTAATITGSVKVRITRPSTDRLEILLECPNLELPVLTLRTKLFESLGVKDNDDA